MTDGAEYQKKAPYPSTFILAVKPEDVDPFACQHESSTPTSNCVHDWRINWGNEPKKSQGRAVYVTDSP